MLIPYATFTEFLENHPKRSDEVKRTYARIKSSRENNEQETASGVAVVGISVESQESKHRDALSVERKAN